MLFEHTCANRILLFAHSDIKSCLQVHRTGCFLIEEYLTYNTVRVSGVQKLTQHHCHCRRVPDTDSGRLAGAQEAGLGWAARTRCGVLAELARETCPTAYDQR